ncbi:MAG: hypothetical protein LBC12_07320 [Nitrososphaerota archaeon]|jgi:membrane protein YqaA with SNARE-associated domain|nr:hypothetical protein [Nitrososphaerota archaeon]
MILLIAVIIAFTLAFCINIVPFFGPSNMFIAAIATIWVDNDTALYIFIIGAIVALGATIARIIQYKVTPLISKHLSEKQRTNLERNATKIFNHSFLILCFAAASPIPEEPVIVSLASVKYSIVKFSIGYFLGKLVITTMGAFTGKIFGNSVSSWVSNTFPEWLSPNVLMTIMSTIVSIIAIAILIKVDLSRLTMGFRRKKQIQNPKFHNL